MQSTNIIARVIAVHRDRFVLQGSEGEPFPARTKTAAFMQGEDYPTVGDLVTIEPNPAGEARILSVQPRKSCFTRLDPSSAGHGAQVVAANFDTLFLMQSLNHDFNPRRLERYLAQAWQTGAQPVVLLTKADLVSDPAPLVQAAKSVALGTPVHVVSAHTGQGLQELAPYLTPGKLLVFLGSSGVGKSSLVNALAGREVMTTNTIREDDSRGRHTTTHRQLITLLGGAAIIDTPGMRSLGMWDAAQGLEQTFADVEAFLGQCRFADCRHQGEPGCAIAAAIAAGELTQARWDSYQKLRKEAGYDENKQNFLRRKQARNKQIAMASRAMKKKR